MDLEDYYNWEKMSLSGIMALMVKWFGFTEVSLEIRQRDNVESGVWYEIKISPLPTEPDQAHSHFVNGQRTDVVKRRLIELLDQLNVRENYKKENDES
jgi:hypothetical protein